MGANHWKFRDLVQVSIFKFFSHSVSPFIFAMKLSRDRSRARSEKPVAKYSDSKFGPTRRRAPFSPAFTNFLGRLALSSWSATGGES
jgi:hypothetical protein